MKRLVIIGLFIALVFSGGWIISKTLDSAGSFAIVNDLSDSAITVPTDEWSNWRWQAAGYFINNERGEVPEKTLDEYYANRMYYGAPPFIPHPVADEQSMGGKDCLKCHGNGGYVPKYKAYAPPTPHPEKVNCKQCLVAQVEKSLFVQTNWEQIKRKPAAIHQEALITSPPPIPHSLTMRENCLSCHAGPSAPKEIRVSHPERINCQQCHAVNDQARPVEPFYKEVK
jgi:cytochrome c-type protein NapB